MERRVGIPHGSQNQLLELQEQVNKDFVGINKHLPKQQRLPKMHTRDLTNCLCEYDKYERALNHERDIKRGYNGTANFCLL